MGLPSLRANGNSSQVALLHRGASAMLSGVQRDFQLGFVFVLPSWE
jgi:hypothetical protein